jgi:MinD superfamily P-loop ATPase
VNEERCLLCGVCARFCRFNAIVCLADRVLVYDELCHSCGGCALVCPAEAISEVSHPMGVVKTGNAGAVNFISGTLNVGEATSPPVIRAAKQAASPAQWTILDAPPGTACPMIETVRDCDYVLLVTEPTPFGLHDLRLAVEVVRTLKLTCGVVVNRADPVATETREWCEQARVPILAEIPDSVTIAKAYSQGQVVVEVVPGLQQIFDRLIARLLTEVRAAGRAPEIRKNMEGTVRAPSLHEPAPTGSAGILAGRCSPGHDSRAGRDAGAPGFILTVQSKKERPPHE